MQQQHQLSNNNNIVLECEHDFIDTQDGYKISGTLFFPMKQSSDNQVALDDNMSSTVILLSGAMGVVSKFYKEFARYMCSNTKCMIATLDYRGCFKSKISKQRVDDAFNGKSENEIYFEIQKKYMTVMKWGRFDLPGMMDFIQKSPLDKLLKLSSDSSDTNDTITWKGQTVKNQFPFTNFIHIGHSIGAQILAYIPPEYLQKFRGTLWVATQSGALQHWPLVLQRAQLFFYWYILLPSMTMMYPKQIPIFGVDNRIIRDWYSAGRSHNKYLFEYFGIEDAKTNSNHLAWVLQEKPVVVYNVENDKYAPYDATMWLTRSFTEPSFVNDLKREHVNEKSKTLKIVDLNFDGDQQVELPALGGKQKRFYHVRGQVAKNIGHFNFFRTKEGREDCWPHMLARCLELLSSTTNDESVVSPIRQSKL